MKESFIDWQPRRKSLGLLGKVTEIMDSYEAQGYTLTLRQLYYQLVSRDLIQNTTREYKNLGGLVSKARLAGLIDWNMIEDRGRVLQGRSHWEKPSDVLESAIDSYYKDRWDGQTEYIEVWVEKDALSGVLYPVCSKYDVRFLANKGYSSSSAMYRAHWRFLNEEDATIIYLGDHDPSGLDMVRDIRDRMDVFGLDRITVKQIALTTAQVRQYNPPENPAKVTDSRYRAYVVEYGPNSWELDALEPKVLDELLTKEIESHIDWDAYHAIEEKEAEDKALLRGFIDQLEE